MPTSTLQVNLYDGTRQLFPAGTPVLLTITDGNQQQIVRQTYNAAQIAVMGLPFYDNFADHYSVLAYVDGYKQAGYSPVKLSPQAPVSLDLMLAPANPVFNFAGLDWNAALARMPFLAPPSGQSLADAQQRLADLMEQTPKSLACMMNLATSMQHMTAGDKPVLGYVKQVRWDLKAPAQDRFFAYCDQSLIAAVQAAVPQEFQPEPNPGLLHPGASVSWKQITLPEANVQLTFHTDAVDCVPAQGWVTLESDIDYYKDLAAHAILEVTRNALTGSLTEPAEVYVLRWIELRRLGLWEFDPGYTLRPS